jgi:single-strand DNA-binding protein
MSSSIIKVEGFVANEPELRRTSDGTPVLTLSVPHTPQRKNEETGKWEDVGPTTWHRVSLWRGDAEMYAPLVKKGTRLIAEGIAEPRVWEKDGKHGAEIEIKRARVALIPRSERATPAQPAAPAAPADEGWYTAPVGDDEPF